jgi:hypothetical protein
MGPRTRVHTLGKYSAGALRYAVALDLTIRVARIFFVLVILAPTGGEAGRISKRTFVEAISLGAVVFPWNAVAGERSEEGQQICPFAGAQRYAAFQFRG